MLTVIIDLSTQSEVLALHAQFQPTITYWYECGANDYGVYIPYYY